MRPSTFTAPKNALVANNRLPRSGEANFTMDGYLMLDRARKPTTVDGVIFDYDNRGNAYLSIYQTAGIDALLVEGNDIRIDRGAGGEPAIHVTANRTNQAFPCSSGS